MQDWESTGAVLLAQRDQQEKWLEEADEAVGDTCREIIEQLDDLAQEYMIASHGEPNAAIERAASALESEFALSQRCPSRGAAVNPSAAAPHSLADVREAMDQARERLDADYYEALRDFVLTAKRNERELAYRVRMQQPIVAENARMKGELMTYRQRFGQCV